LELRNEFRITMPAREAWKILCDLEQIASMVPGAQLDAFDGQQYRGSIRVKVGAIAAAYRGSASFIERDETAGRLTLRASGRDARGQGTAIATVTAMVAPDGDGALVSVHTDLTITGKVAQFGRGVLADVSAGLIRRFVENLEAALASGRAEGRQPA
jgi:uncharacterized protein